MRIRFLSGPKTGEVRHAEKSQATQLLVDAGLVEVVDDLRESRGAHPQDTVPTYYATPEWSTFRHHTSGNIIIVRKYMTETLFFSGPPDPNKWDCPPAVVAQFNALTQRGVDIARATEQEMAAGRNRHN
jgi:hypothetical protein